jgi:hypothetical protein
MKKFWISWYCAADDMGKFELHTPWWISGTRCSDDAETICAAVQAEDEEAAKKAILNSYDDPPKDLEWRFVNERSADWSPFCDRFQQAKWMKWAA